MLEKEPFKGYRNEEEKADDKRKVIPISLNLNQLEELDIFRRRYMGMKSQGFVIKYSSLLAIRCITMLFTPEFFKGLFIKKTEK